MNAACATGVCREVRNTHEKLKGFHKRRKIIHKTLAYMYCIVSVCNYTMYAIVTSRCKSLLAMENYWERNKRKHSCTC